MKREPIERGSLYAKILIEYVKKLRVLFYSISHSWNYCVCSYGTVPCGIDIEKKRILPSYLFLEGFAKESEGFLRQWVEVESYAKLKQIPLYQFGRYDEMKFKGVKFVHILEIEGYECCVCVNETEMISKYVYFLTDHPKNLKLS